MHSLISHSQASLDAGEAETCGARLNRQDTGCCTVWKLVRCAATAAAAFTGL